MGSALTCEFSKRTVFFHLKVWVVIGILVVIVLLIFPIMLFCLTWKRKTHKVTTDPTLPVTQNPIMMSSEFKEIRMDQNSANKSDDHINDTNKIMVLPSFEKMENGDNSNQSCSFNHFEEGGDNSHSGDKGYLIKHDDTFRRIPAPSPLSGSPEFSHLGWGHWFTLRDLGNATNNFSHENIIGDGGYGVVYQGHLVNGTAVAVKKLLNNMGQAEKEFRVEVEAIGHVRHTNLVRLLGFCIEGTQRLLVYEYVKNGNLEQWLHGAMRQYGYLTWEARIKILLGTAKGLAYLHEAIEPKVVHRDIKSSNILINHDFSAKISDFGLAKLLNAGKSHITTRVMGTFGYVAPEYANSGLLNEKSDVYSFGIVLLEAITGRDPVDYGRPAHEVTLVDWLKMMVGNKRSEEVVDPTMESRPSTSALKRALLTALRCVDPDFDKRPKMSQVVRMLESEEYPTLREERRRSRKSQANMTQEELVTKGELRHR